MQEIEKFGLKIVFGIGSSTHHPERKGGITTCDLKEWIKFADKWFTTYGRFTNSQVKQMLEICTSEYQVISLMELLSAKN